jgi:hypothetical protein
MSDCEVCKPEPEKPLVGPGERIPMPGTRHRPDCPLIPRMEPSEELRKQLAAIKESERKAWAAAQGWVMG